MRVTKAAETYAALTKLTAEGVRLSDAVRTLAAETGRSEAAIRASYYQQRVKLGLHGRRPPGPPLSAEEATVQARTLLEQVLAAIEDELAVAKAEADAAQERYRRLHTEADQVRSELQRKITALSPPHDVKKGGKRTQ